MNAQDLTHYLADQPPSVVRLEIEKHFEALNDKQKRYAHYISKYVCPTPHAELALVLTPLTHAGLLLREAGLPCASSPPSPSPSLT
jgi:hypothetical protein